MSGGLAPTEGLVIALAALVTVALVAVGCLLARWLWQRFFAR